MRGILIRNAHVYTPTGDWLPGWLLTEGTKIKALGPGQPPEYPEEAGLRVIDAGGSALLPGLIDLHVHGALGHEAMDASRESLQVMARLFAQNGVTGFLPTTWTASREVTLAVLHLVRDLEEPFDGGASILGVHMEGPYFNPAKAGAQDPTQIRRAEKDEALEFLDSGVVRLIAVAPEFPENLWLVDECVRRGIRVAAGHTAATYEEMKTAVEHGVRQTTHTFNAMTGLGHREPGTVGAALTMPELQCELIADNVHVHPAAQKILVSVKGPQNVILITDAIRGAGLPEGSQFQVDTRTAVVHNGAAYLADGTLAGSIQTLNNCLRNVIANTGLSLAEAWPMASLNPARAIGLAASKGSLEAGKDADLVLLNEKYEALLTVVMGRIVWEAERLQELHH